MTTHAVLLVDDDADVLHSLARMLQKQPYQLYTARSGEDAKSTLKARSVDVIVADERMPEMSGTDLLAWVARHYPDVVRIMVTGHAVTETAIRIINEVGVFHFFTKPCNEAHLAVMIRKALEHKDLLAKEKRLVEINVRQAGDRERFTKELEVLNHLIARDVKEPLRSAALCCQSLVEERRELLDPGARSLVERSIEAISDIQCVVNDMLARMLVWQSDGRYGRTDGEPQLTATTRSG